MRFTGQVRVPEVDHPGIPATIVVEDGLAEVLLEGESLGRWSLYDVHAARLVSSAFSISLDGEEITFIADEPVDFAYKGVEHMAGVWARYKAMTMPRRVVAVGRSRRGTTPSRIPELREAMLANLMTAGRTSAPSIPAPGPAEPETGPSPWASRLDAYSRVPPPIDDNTDELSPSEGATTDQPDSVEPDLAANAVEPDIVAEAAGLDRVVEPGTAPNEVELGEEGASGDPAVDVETGSSSVQRARLRPGPGLIPRPVKPAPSLSSTDPLDWESAWEEPPVEEAPHYEEVPADADLVYLKDDFTDEETPAAFVEESATAEVEEAVEPETVEPEAVEPEETHDETPPAGVPPQRELVLDLGRLEVEQRKSEPEPPTALPEPPEEVVEPDLELLFAGAPMPDEERSGLFGAVRSAFARNRGGVHEHQFVEAPGGIGIVRQICAECGYISIGVSD